MDNRMKIKRYQRFQIMIIYLLLLAIIILLLFNAEIRAKKRMPDYTKQDFRIEKMDKPGEEELLLTEKDGLLLDKRGWAYPSAIKQRPLIDEKKFLAEGWAIPPDEH